MCILHICGFGKLPDALNLRIYNGLVESLRCVNSKFSSFENKVDQKRWSRSSNNHPYEEDRMMDKKLKLKNLY